MGPFLLEAALTLEALEEASPQELGRRIIPLRDCLPGLRPVRVSPEEARRLRQGRPLPCPEGDLTLGQQVRVLTAQELVAVARVRDAASQVWLTPVRVFSSSQQPAVGSETQGEPWTVDYR